MCCAWAQTDSHTRCCCQACMMLVQGPVGRPTSVGRSVSRVIYRFPLLCMILRACESCGFMAVHVVQVNPPQCSWCGIQAIPCLVPARLQPPAAAYTDAAAAQLGLHPQGCA
jgi:hypothetical protein